MGHTSKLKSKTFSAKKKITVAHSVVAIPSITRTVVFCMDMAWPSFLVKLAR